MYKEFFGHDVTPLVPLFAAIGVGGLVMGAYTGNILLSHPDVYLIPSSRHNPIHDNQQEAKTHYQHVVRRAAVKDWNRDNQTWFNSLVPPLNRALMPKRPKIDMNKITDL